MVGVWNPVLALASLLHFAGPLLSTPVLQQGLTLGLIRYSEPARYDADSLRMQHRRVRRGVVAGAGVLDQDLQVEPLTINFTAHNRDFRLHLRPDTSVFAEDVQFEGTKGSLHYDTSRVYVGSLQDDEQSTVEGVVTEDGLFDGTITTPSDQFFVEPAHRYLDSPPFHSVIYRAVDVDPPNTVNCASQLLHERGRGRERHHKEQQHRKEQVVRHRRSSANHDRWWTPSQRSSRQGRPATEYSADYNDYSDSSSSNLRTLNHSEESMSDLSAHSPSRANSNSTFHPTRNVDFVISSSPNHNFRDTSSLEDFSEPYNTYSLNKHPKVSHSDNDADPADNNSVHPSKTNTTTSFTPENTNKIVLYNHTILIRPKSPVDDSGSNLIKPPPEPEVYSKVLSGYYLPEDDPRHFHKRATIDPKKTTCMLYLQADHLFYQKYGTEEACIEVMTRHVQRVNAIYRTTDFNQDGKADNISFMIKRIKVHSSDALKDSSYRFPDNYGVEKFLELFSEEDYDAFCLAYMFTYRDFEMGTLGLAWTGDLKNAGGVCEKNGHYRGSLKSLNTGIVTLLNYGKHVPPAVSHVTLAHEIGHNFGSPHDPELCTPGGEDGNFIMFARATSGDKKNNNHFSPCSLNSINPVLNAKARSSKGCFTEPQAAICGNGVVEPGEECDCGWEEDCRDNCCYPQRRYPPPEEPPCKLTPRSMCSPSQGPCCTSDCHLKFGDKCRDDNGCRDSSFCDGRGPHCPPSVNKPNKTICNDEFVCFMGECTGSICLAYGLESCQCIPGPKDLPTKACELCCKMPGENQPCLSSFMWNSAPYDIPDMFSKPGTPCNDYNGYCDVFQKCREVDPSGPLATLRKLLLSEESIASFKKWVSDNWYFVLLIAAAVLVLLVMSAKLLAKRPDPKLLSVTIIHSSTTEAVRLPGDGTTPTIVHPATARKLPLKRRVRLDRRRRKDGRNKTAPAPAPAPSAPPAPSIAPATQTPPPATAPVSSGTGGDAAAVAAALVAAAERGNKKTTKKPALPSSTAEKETNSAPPKPSSGAELLLPSPTETSRKPPVTKLNIKKANRKAKKKEVIDYSSKQGDQEKVLSSGSASPLALTPSEDPMGKVQNWLLSSQSQREAQEKHSLAAPAAQVTKSKSSPAGLADSPHRRSLVQPTGRTDTDKVRLQVLYKTPFKFRLKFKSAGSGVTTKLSADRVRKVPAERSSSSDDNVVGGIAGPRTAMLVRTREARGHHRKHRRKASADGTPVPAVPAPVMPVPLTPSAPRDADIDSNIHTVPSDLEGLLLAEKLPAGGGEA